MKNKPRKVKLPCGHKHSRDELIERFDDCLSIVKALMIRDCRRGWFHEGGIFGQIANSAITIGMEKLPKKRKKKKA